MRRLLLASAAAAALLSMTLPSEAAIVASLGVNPTSAQGDFSASPIAGAFEDQVTFTLSGGPSFVTIASATNVYAQPSDQILNWTAAIWSAGPDQVVNNLDDVLLFGPQAAVACPTTANCQQVGGSGLINTTGLFYAEFIGIASGSSGYGGNISTFAVPGPIIGGGIPGLVMALGGFFGWRRLRSQA